MSSKVRCAFCKDYVVKESALRLGIQSFCGKEHRNQYLKHGKGAGASTKTNTEKLADKKRASDKFRKSARRASSSSGGDDSANVSTAVREAVRANDREKCRFCGSTHNLHLHHIKYRSELKISQGRDNLTNLITLCSDHHSLVHTNKAVWQPVLLEAARLREERGILVPIPTLKKRMRL